MNPEVQQFIDQHGGLGVVVKEGPDANGTVTYRAPSGDYIVVRGNDGGISMRGFSPPAEGTAQQQAPPVQPAAPQAPATSGRMTQQQLQGLVGAQTPSGGQWVFNQGTKAKTVKSIAGEETVQVPYVQWIDPATGRTIEADVEPGGSDYTVTLNGIVPGNKTKEAANPDTPAGRQAAEEEREKQWNRDNGGLYETHAQRRAREQAEADRKRNQDRQDAADAERNRPTTTIKDDGKGGLVAIQTYPDGRAPVTTPIPGVTGKPDQVTVNGVVYERGADGSYAPAKGLPTTGKDDYAPEPESLSSIPLTHGNLSAGLKAYSEQLDKEVKLYESSGGKQGVSPEKATRLMQRRVALAESMLKEQTGNVNTQTGLLNNATTQRGQTMGDVQNRRGTAERIHSNTLNTLIPLAKGMGPGGGALLSKAINDTLAGALGYAQQWGGMTDVPEIDVSQYPALAAVRGAGGPITTPGAPPPIVTPRPVTGPNALGVGGGIGAPPSMTPEQAAAQRAQAVQNAGGVLPPPIFRPQGPAQVPAATNPIDNSPIVVPPTPTTPSGIPQPTVPGARDNNSPPPPANVPGMPGYDPARPVGKIMTPMLSATEVGERMARPNIFSGATDTLPTMPQMGLPRFAQEARYGAFFDPDEMGAGLAARLGIDPEIMKLAAAGMYG